MDASVTPTEVDAAGKAGADAPQDAGPDPNDAATEYAGPDGSMDAATVFDAGSSDAGQSDAAMVMGSDAAAMSDATTDDAAVSDAATNDAAQSDAANSDAGPSACPGAIFCQDFEDGVAATSTTSTTQTRTVAESTTSADYTSVRNGSITESTTRRHGGGIALHATTGAVSATGNEARYATRVLGQQRSGEVWLRYYYYLPSSVVITSHFSAGVVSEIEPPYEGIFLMVRQSRVDIGGMLGSTPGLFAMPRDQWVCVELQVVVDGAAGVATAYLDGQVLVSTTPGNTLPADGYTNAEVGIHYTEGTQGPVEAYVDDVVVSTSRYPCEP